MRILKIGTIPVMAVSIDDDNVPMCVCVYAVLASQHSIVIRRRGLC